jgi:angiomotin like 1
VLDAALSNAQNTVLRLEEEVRQKEAYADRVKQMTKSLEQLQVPVLF